MPRSKTVPLHEAQKEIAASLQRFLDGLRSPKARKQLVEYADRFAMFWSLCQFFLSLSKLSRKRAAEMFRIDASELIPATDALPLTNADLSLLKKVMDMATAMITGQSPKEVPSPQEWARFMNRFGARQVKPRKFKPEYRQAFQHREQARGEGKKITLKELAKRFTPASYEHHPESAVRAMGNALQRIERDSRRIEAATAANAKIKNKIVRQRRNP